MRFASGAIQAVPVAWRLILAGLTCVLALLVTPVRAADDPLSASGSSVVLRVMAFLGVPYVYGGDDPRGFDCSGLVRQVFRDELGLLLPRTAEDIARVAQRVTSSDLQPGDLVFFNTRGRPFSHVGIYIGDRQFVHAPASRGQVRIETLDAHYWKRRFNGARRLVMLQYNGLPPDAAPFSRPHCEGCTP